MINYAVMIYRACRGWPKQKKEAVIKDLVVKLLEAAGLVTAAIKIARGEGGEG